ncbi:MAG: shikimate kinase [Gemmatimonadales bacterium]|nr:shikimate kinase [Gemmatimonadales bacterium]
MMQRKHLVLVGLPGSGKSTVGRLVAETLGTALTDLDRIVAGASGRSVAELFAEQGEPAFRRIERAAMDGAIAAPPHVIAPGGGWIAEPGNLEAAGHAWLLYLAVAPETAAERLAGDLSRPLLAGPDRGESLRDLLRQRERWYRRAQDEIDAAGPPEAVARLVIARARAKAGW